MWPKSERVPLISVPASLLVSPVQSSDWKPEKVDDDAVTGQRSGPLVQPPRPCSSAEPFLLIQARIWTHGNIWSLCSKPQKQDCEQLSTEFMKVNQFEPESSEERPWLECSLLGETSPVCQSYGSSEIKKAIVVPIIPPAVYQVQARRGGLAKTISGVVLLLLAVSCSSLGSNKLQSQLQINDPRPLPPVAGKVCIRIHSLPSLIHLHSQNGVPSLSGNAAPLQAVVVSAPSGVRAGVLVYLEGLHDISLSRYECAR